jgi:hypothetical protein
VGLDGIPLVPEILNILSLSSKMVLSSAMKCAALVGRLVVESHQRILDTWK